MVVPQGGEFKLTCRAVGVPDPYINWRLNWQDVCEPPRCQQVSEGGVGTLTVQNAQSVKFCFLLKLKLLSHNFYC